jgi:hypothetical protein
MAEDDKGAGGDKAKQPGNKNKLATGVAVGIGSAAIVAALLYANRSKKKPGQAD